MYIVSMFVLSEIYSPAQKYGPSHIVISFPTSTSFPTLSAFCKEDGAACALPCCVDLKSMGGIFLGEIS